MAATRDLKALPKADLHVHLEGAMRPETLTELCHKHKVPRPEDTQGKRFANFGGFTQAYSAVCECLRDEEDIFRMVLELGEDLKACGATWAEPAIAMSRYHQRFGGPEATLQVFIRVLVERLRRR